MTPTRFREVLSLIGWSQRRVALLLKRCDTTPKQWVSGKVRIPNDVAQWLETIADFYLKNPPPQRKGKGV